MNRRAALKVWGLPVIWLAGDEPAQLAAAAETAAPAQVVHYHQHVHLPPGADLSWPNLALPAGSAVTTEEGN